MPYSAVKDVHPADDADDASVISKVARGDELAFIATWK
jgi:hypothetical protein